MEKSIIIYLCEVLSHEKLFYFWNKYKIIRSIDNLVLDTIMEIFKLYMKLHGVVPKYIAIEHIKRSYWLHHTYFNRDSDLYYKYGLNYYNLHKINSWAQKYDVCDVHYSYINHKGKRKLLKEPYSERNYKKIDFYGKKYGEVYYNLYNNKSDLIVGSITSLLNRFVFYLKYY